MKKIPLMLTVLSATLFVGFIIANAQDYAPLAPLPGTYTGAAGSETTNLSTYLGGAIKLLIALGAGFAIFMSIVGGVQFVAAGASPAAKTGAKERIRDAFVGLALILSSYLLLKTINPDLVNFKLELPKVGQTTVVVAPPDGVGGSPGAWGNDAATRLRFKNAGVTVKDPVCTTVGQRNCTSVYQLPDAAINGVISLKNDCKCDVVVTQGTEYWLHKQHGTATNRAPVVDLRYQETMNSFITKGRTPKNPQSGCGIRNADHYNVGGATYVLENPGTNNVHWHVCY